MLVCACVHDKGGNNKDITFVVTLRLGRVVGPARRQLLAVCRRRCGLRSRLVPRAPRARAPATDHLSDATLFDAISDTGTIILC